MSCLFSVPPLKLNPTFQYLSHSKNYQSSLKLVPPCGLTVSPNFSLQFLPKIHLKFPRISRYGSLIYSLQRDGEDYIDDEETVDDLTVPNDWLDNSKASEESEWLRVTLHKWLDDEYCPEPTNVKISDIASRSFYKSLMNKQTDLGEILLEMVRDLESISYQESFHGAFSSANAAIGLIIQRIQPH